jgi:hypothetical protein
VSSTTSPPSPPEREYLLLVRTSLGIPLGEERIATWSCACLQACGLRGYSFVTFTDFPGLSGCKRTILYGIDAHLDFIKTGIATHAPRVAFLVASILEQGWSEDARVFFALGHPTALPRVEWGAECIGAEQGKWIAVRHGASTTPLSGTQIRSLGPHCLCSSVLCIPRTSDQEWRRAKDEFPLIHSLPAALRDRGSRIVDHA